jgi:cytoskeleton protein RodZ
VEALENVEISYSTAGGTPQKVKLNGEQTHTFRSQSGLKLNISNGAAVNIILNGRDLGKPGDAGKPISLTY